ncbi:MAG TPA: hypothetical protein EYQ31_01995 [Candidatus Handelsmanbacteria bacterium]|nr:hypothetical protein [Candidatus Handelsmanbacteria bacterium]
MFVAKSLLGGAGVPEGRFDPEDIRLLGAILREANFRSVMPYIDRMKQYAIRNFNNFSWSEAHALARQDVRRAARRGLGPSSKASPFPLERAPELGPSPKPLGDGGPLGGFAIHVIAGWYLLREIEAAAIVVADVSFPSEKHVTMQLQASKSDIEAKGVERTLPCCCGACPGAPSALPSTLCPRCVTWTAVQFVTKKFPDIATERLPLFPTVEGDVVSKAKMIMHIEESAARLDITAVNRAGSQKWGGHAWRRGGAQFIARNAVPVPEIKYLARHSSSAIDLYLEGVEIKVNLGPPAQLTAAISSANDIDQLPHQNVNFEKVQRVQGGGPSSPGQDGPPLHEVRMVLASSTTSYTLRSCGRERHGM